MERNVFQRFLSACGTFFGFIFGQISWTTPPWIKYLHHKAHQEPKTFWTGTISFLILVGLLFYGYCYYQSLPKPERIITQITPPNITPLAKTLEPNNLVIRFGIIKNGELSVKPVAPLQLVGKEVENGISISPQIPGKWYWDSDSQLVFTPSIDWPAGETYTVYFSKDFFTQGAPIKSWKESFTTLPFDVVIKDFKFYQDPLNPNIRQAIASLHFNFPVDAGSLQDHISLAYQKVKNAKFSLGEQSFKFSLTFDEHKRIAYLRSEPITLPDNERYLELNLAKGIRALSGPAKTPVDVHSTLLIPDQYTYFKIDKAQSSIVRNENDRPEQVLTLETSLGVTEAEIQKSLHVYLLPKDYPKTASEEAKSNYYWQSPAEVTDKILALAKPVELKPIPSDRNFATLHSFKYHAVTPAYIYVKLDKGTRGFGDFLLAKDYTTTIKVPEYPQEISFLHKGALLALGTEEKLSVLVRGLPAVRFDVGQVLPNDINHLVTQTNGDFSNPNFFNVSFNKENISEITAKIEDFDVSDPAKEQYTAINLQDYLAKKQNGNRLGLFLLEAEGWDKKNNESLNIKTNRLVLITDLGLIIKNNLSGTHDVFVQSIMQGTPVKNANVSILGKNGLPLFTHPTDEFGHTSFETLTDFLEDQEPVVYIAKNGNDVSFIPYAKKDRELNFSRFDVGGVRNDTENQAALTGYLFSDRGIYRPGDLAHIGIIVKKPFAVTATPGIPLEVTIVDPRGVTVKDEKLSLNDTGFFTIDFQTTETGSTGQYNVNLYIVKDNQPSSLIGSTQISVAEFLPDRLRIALHLSEEAKGGWVSPEGLKATIDLANLYGAPAEHHKISGKILLKPKALSFPEFPNYTFTDPLLDPKKPAKVFSETLTSVQTNDQGQAELDLKLDRFEKATYELTLFAEGFELEGGRSVTAQTTALVSPLTYFVGYKPEGDLQFIKQNGERSVHFIAINHQLKQQALPNLKLQLFSQRPVASLVKKEDGTYQYQSILQTNLISSNPLNISDQGASFSLPTQQIGEYLVVVLDPNGTELSRFKFAVVGASQQPLPKNAELSIQLNKSEFNPGEDIEMQITAPYIGAGLITIERDKVYAQQWFKTNTTASVQKIHIPNDFEGNGYVTVAFVRNINSPEIYISPLSYNVLPFSVTHKNREIQVDLDIPALSLPGKEFPITYKTDKPSKIVVFAVDEGILQVAKYEAPDPIKFFFQKRALEVNTLQIVDQILPKFIADRDLSSVGGDGGEAALRKMLNPFKRKTETPVVFWSQILDADQTPRKLIYQLPNYFNGTLRVIAVAVAKDAVGSATKTANIRGHFVINPNVPTFVAPNDEFDVTLAVANNIEKSGDNAQINVEIAASPGLEIVSDAKQDLTIPEGQERSVRFRVRAKDLLGSPTLKFIASGHAPTNELKQSEMSSTLSIRPPSPFNTTIRSGFSNNASKTLPLDRVLYPEYRKVNAFVSSSPLILVSGLSRYLDTYPFGCTEQLVSKAFPWLAMANQPWFVTDTKALNDKITQTIQMLTQRQLSSGAFNFWPNTEPSENLEFISVYAMHFLTEAKAQGYNVPNDVFSSGLSYLKDLVTQKVKNIEQARIHAYAIYILTRNEIVTTNYLTHLQSTLEETADFNWHDDIMSAYIAATYQLLKNTADANQIIDYYRPNQKEVVSTTDFYNRQIANAQYLYIVAKHFPERLSAIKPDYIMNMVDAMESNSISTILSAYSSLALAAYHQHYPMPNNAALSISETLSDGKQNALSSSNMIYQNAEIQENAKNITFTDPDKIGYFYQLVQSGFDKTTPKPMNSKIEVYRELQNADNKIIDNVKLGDEIFVHIRARSIDNEWYDNIALVDLLPGGFEVVRDSVSSLNVSYVDVREDRVVFFDSVGPHSKEIIYRIKATNVGQFIVPPMFATAMYRPQVQSIGVAGKIKIENSPS